MHVHVYHLPEAAYCTQQAGVLVYHPERACVTFVTTFCHALAVVCDGDA